MQSIQAVSARAELADYLAGRTKAARLRALTCRAADRASAADLVVPMDHWHWSGEDIYSLRERSFADECVTGEERIR